MKNYKSGNVEYLGTKPNGQIVIRDNSIADTDVLKGPEMIKTIAMLVILQALPLSCKITDSSNGAVQSLDNTKDPSEYSELKKCLVDINTPNPNGLNEFWSMSLKDRWSAYQRKRSDPGAQLKFDLNLKTWVRLNGHPMRDMEMGMFTSFRENSLRGVYKLRDNQIAKVTNLSFGVSPENVEGLLLGECLGGPTVHGFT